MKQILLLLLIVSGFSGSAQTACDSLEIDAKYAAFYDSLIEVTVINHSQKFYSYPGFVLYDGNGDTVAKETVNLFGIGGASSHGLILYPGMPPGPLFSGRLDLYSWFYDSLECSLSRSFKLCPDTCKAVYPIFSNAGNALITGSFAWDILNSSAQSVASGSFVMTPTEQYDEDTTCLPPGIYTLKVTGAASGGQPYIGITDKSINLPYPAMPYTSAAATIDFHFFNRCASPTSVGGLQANDEVLISSYGKSIYLKAKSGKAKGSVAVYNLLGQRVYRSDGVFPERIDLVEVPDGIYLVSWSTGGMQGGVRLWLGN